MIGEPAVQPWVEARRHGEHCLVTVKVNDIAHAFPHGLTMATLREMLLHRTLQGGIKISLDVIGNLTPNILAFYDHGFVPFGICEWPAQGPSNPGARRSRNIRRARNNRVLTAPADIPSASAVSPMLMCSTSRKTNTSRYFCASEPSAAISFSRISLRSSASVGISRQSAKSRGVYVPSSFS